MKKVTKLFNTTIKSVDEENRTITFCFSDDQEDRMHEIVDQGSWQTKNYEQNPLILWGHDPSQPENVLGQGIDLNLNVGGKSYVTAQFDDDETNPKAGLVFRQLVKRTLRCVSAGFIPHSYNTDDDTPVLKDNELLEISIVPIPANPRAVALAYKEGSISKKDATWLMDSMRKESDLLEAQMKAQEEHEIKEKNMTDEQAKALIDSVATLTKSVDELKTTSDERFKALDEQIQTIATKDQETEDEKAAREAEEAEAAKKAEEESKKPPAKSGSDDQGGAGDDEFDENAELTPEQEAALDETFAEQLAELEPAA